MILQSNLCSNPDSRCHPLCAYICVCICVYDAQSFHKHTLASCVMFFLHSFLYFYMFHPLHHPSIISRQVPDNIFSTIECERITDKHFFSDASLLCMFRKPRMVLDISFCVMCPRARIGGCVLFRTAMRPRLVSRLMRKTWESVIQIQMVVALSIADSGVAYASAHVSCLLGLSWISGCCCCAPKRVEDQLCTRLHVVHFCAVRVFV